MKTPEELVQFIGTIESLGPTGMGGLDGNEDHSVYSRREAMLLAKYACKIPYGGTAVEIGVYVGHTASILLSLEEDLNLDIHLVDCWSWMMPHAKNSFDLMIKRFPGSKYTDHWMLSSEANQEFRASPHGLSPDIDYIHIDGDHDWRETGVNNDCELWLPLLKSGGVACFHDSFYEPVARAIATYCPGWAGEEAGRTTVRIKP